LRELREIVERRERRVPQDRLGLAV